MRRMFMRLTSFLLRLAPAGLSLLLSFNLFLPSLAETYTATVVSVPDGDSINVMHGTAKERVILYGVDCPEIGQEFGQEARDFTDQRCYKKQVGIEVHGVDSKGRVIGV